MPGPPVCVRADVLGGAYEVIGSDRGRGIVVEDLEIEDDEWGPSGQTFNLRRTPGFPWPDLGAFTPIDIEIGGVQRSDGRVKQTPIPGNRQMNVQSEGWQFHLDDDQYERKYVQTKLADWKDARSFPSSQLATLLTTGQVQADKGVITLGWGANSTLTINTAVGVTLDLGPSNTAKRMVVSWDQSGGVWPNNNISMFIRTHDTTNAFGGTTEDLGGAGINITTAGAGPTTTAGTFTTAQRYVTIFLFYTGATGVTASQIVVRLNAIKVFADAAYESGNASILKASDVVSDALGRATALLSADRTGIRGDLDFFSLPDFSPDEPRTPRQNWLAVDSFHDWQKMVAVGRRAVYKAKPSTPTLEIGPWASGDFSDGSANSGEEIYNRDIVTGTAPDGSVIRSARTTPATGSPVFSNPSFAVDASSWSLISGSAFTRYTTDFQSTPACGRLENSSGSTLNLIARGTVVGVPPGATIRVQGYLKTLGAQPGSKVGGVWVGVQSTGAWQPFDIVTTQGALGYIEFVSDHAPTGTSLLIDSLTISVADASLPSRRGFYRTKQLPVQAPLPTDLTAANALGDLWLTGHKTTPFKGEREVYRGDVRNLLTGQIIEPCHLGLYVNEMIRFSDRVDPDTGAWGRDGRLTKVRYVHVENKAYLTIDNTQATFEAALARLESIVG